ncbi:hypothetical protein G7054_g13649 [Neopestalotiopsis clavispora]|nr:hypothetical protein G7054_g13649 [Neopestalotiopsis clavispora]
MMKDVFSARAESQRRLSFSYLPVLARHKRHLGDDGVPLTAAHLDLDLGAALVLTILDVAHGDVLAQGRGRAAAGDDANLVAAGVDDLGALAGGWVYATASREKEQLERKENPRWQ